MKVFKGVLTAFLVVAMAICFTACAFTDNTPNEDSGLQQSPAISGNTTSTPSGNADQSTQTPSGNITSTPSGNQTQTPPKDDEPKILIVYFSCTNTTKGWAQTLQSGFGADIYEIVAAIPYTDDDLKYYTNCRADQEQNDPTARPEISGGVDNIAQYDVIYIGYPIWHGQAPKIIYTFLESYDFEGKTLIPFCTSASSGMGTSGNNLHNCAPAASWKAGCRVSSLNDIDTLKNMK